MTVSSSVPNVRWASVAKGDEEQVSNQTADRSWRWRDAGLAALIWYVPITGLLGATTAPSTDRILGSLLIGLLVGIVLSAPLSSIQAQVAKTSTAKRVLEAVWTAAAGAAALALLGLDARSLFSVLAGLASLWLALAVSAAVRPLSIARTGPQRDAVSWLPVRPRSSAAATGKRIFDLVVSALALAVIAPVLVSVALAIKASDGGPVFFKQRRVGRDGIPFEMIKFRSMVLNAEELKSELEAQNDRSGPLFKMSNDPRITSVGRIIRELSIDELPQLLNILRGDMSLVGPRPALPDEAAQFDTRLQRRNIVTPGLTGLWQAEARSDADFQRFRDLDLRYVSTATPALDLWIILATATEVLVSVAAIPLGALGITVGQSDGIDLRSEPVDNVIDLRTNVDHPAPRPTAA